MIQARTLYKIKKENDHHASIPLQISLQTPYLNPVANKLLNPLFEETVEVHNSECETSSKGIDQTRVAQKAKEYDYH